MLLGSYYWEIYLWEIWCWKILRSKDVVGKRCLLSDCLTIFFETNVVGKCEDWTYTDLLWRMKTKEIERHFSNWGISNKMNYRLSHVWSDQIGRKLIIMCSCGPWGVPGPNFDPDFLPPDIFFINWEIDVRSLKHSITVQEWMLQPWLCGQEWTTNSQDASRAQKMPP